MVSCKGESRMNWNETMKLKEAHRKKNFIAIFKWKISVECSSPKKKFSINCIISNVDHVNYFLLKKLSIEPCFFLGLKAEGSVFDLMGVLAAGFGFGLVSGCAARFVTI